MTTRGWPMLSVVALCACVAIGCGVYLLSGGTETQLVIAIVSLVLGLALAAVATTFYVQSNSARRYLLQLRNDMRTADRHHRDGHGRTEYLAQQVLELRNRGEQINSAIMSEFSQLKSGYSSLSNQVSDLSKTHTSFGAGAYKSYGFENPEFASPTAADDRAFPKSVFGLKTSDASAQFGTAFGGVPGRSFSPADKPAHQFPHSPRPDIAAHVAAAANEPHEDYSAHAQQGSFVDRLSTSLEPIVDLFTGKTTHYRLHLGMVRDDGEEVSSDTVLHHADRTGLRAGFDLHAAREALILLHRLRQRDPALSIFLPAGAQTLQSEDTVQRVLKLMTEHPEVAGGLVFEIPHAMLAGLSNAGLEGLAKLARAGHTLSLSNISTAGVDLHSLSKMNVRFVSLSVANAAGPDGPSPQILQFAQTARSLRVHLVVTNVADQRMVSGISKVTRFASGPAFAEPRRVRADVTNGQPVGYSNVA